MSLPNDDDDENSRPPWRDPFDSKRDNHAISPVKKLSAASSSTSSGNDDDRTADETSVGSMSFSSDLNSVAAAAAAHGGGGANNAVPSTPSQPRTGTSEAPLSALSTDTAIRETASVEGDDRSVQSGVSFSSHDPNTIIRRRQMNRRQLQRLGIATGATFALFVYMLIPTALLLSLILFGSVSSAFWYQLVMVARWEFNRSILEGRGIGDYLPAGLYELLTSTSIHDILSDPNGIFGASEHIPYLMLYMIPGLTQEQLDRYVDRLNPNHQRLLRNQQGLLGFALNRNNHLASGSSNDDNDNGNTTNDSTMMRVLMGDERLREWRQQQQTGSQSQSHPSGIAPRRLELPPTIPEGGIGEEETDGEESIVARRRIPTDESADVPTPQGLSSSNPVETAGQAPPLEGIPATVAAIVGRASTAAPAPPPPSSRSSSNTSSNTPPPPSPTGSENGMVLLDAMGSAMANIVGEATTTVRQGIRDSFLETFGLPLYRASLGVTAIGLGLGAYGLANGTYDVATLSLQLRELITGTLGSLLGGSGGGSSGSSAAPRVRLSFSMPSGGFLLGSTVASGSMAVVLGLFSGSSSSSSNDGFHASKPPCPPTREEDPASSKKPNDL